MRTVLVFLLLAAGVVAGVVYHSTHVSASSAVVYHTTPIVRGNLLSTISATGTVEPEELVDVGAQVAGLIVAFGPDPHSPSKLIDYNSVVEKDQVLAYLDQTSYLAAVDQAEAALEKSKADLLQLEAKCRLAEQAWKRAENLRSKNAIADADFDTFQSEYKAAQANVAVGKAAIRQSEASLRTARVNLGYTIIKSPVRGKIITRRVNVGQTVVASLSAPSLFLIAKDLRRMQVWASVNEADIGQIRVGMPTNFTVDTYSGETFHGTVTQIRMDATMTQNVVTYTIVVTTDNSSEKLLPYMTANVKFEVQRREDVLLVPNTALRWKPESSQLDPSASETLAALSTQTAANSPSPSTDSASKNVDRGCLWIPSGANYVKPLAVAVGPTDGMKTEVSGSDLGEGLRVVSSASDPSDEDDADSESTESDATSNPFLPKIPKGRRPPTGPM